MDNLKKINAIIAEYTVRPDNQHVGTGTGGNLNHYLFIADKELAFSNEVESIVITDDKVLFNPEYTSKTSGKQIRDELDSIIAKLIAETGFIAPIRMVDGKFIFNDIDAEKNTVTAKLLKASKKCAELSNILDSGQLTDQYCAEFVDCLDSAGMPIVLFAFRTQVGLERIVNHNLDDHKILGPFLLKINRSANIAV